MTVLFLTSQSIQNLSFTTELSKKGQESFLYIQKSFLYIQNRRKGKLCKTWNLNFKFKIGFEFFDFAAELKMFKTFLASFTHFLFPAMLDHCSDSACSHLCLPKGNINPQTKEFMCVCPDGSDFVSNTQQTKCNIG